MFWQLYSCIFLMQSLYVAMAHVLALLFFLMHFICLSPATGGGYLFRWFRQCRCCHVCSSCYNSCFCTVTGLESLISIFPQTGFRAAGHGRPLRRGAHAAAGRDCGRCPLELASSLLPVRFTLLEAAVKKVRGKKKKKNVEMG